MKTLVRIPRRARSSKGKARPASTTTAGELRTPGGASARLRGSELTLHTPDGGLVASWDGQRLIIGPASGDLVLQAPEGRVTVSGQQVELVSKDTTRVGGKTLSIEVQDVRVAVEAVAVVASKLVEVSAPALEQTLGRVRTDAGRLVERAGSVFRDVEDVVETHAGRIRTAVRGATHWFSRATTVVSEEDTFIDGKRVLLG